MKSYFCRRKKEEKSFEECRNCFEMGAGDYVKSRVLCIASNATLLNDEEEKRVRK